MPNPEDKIGALWERTSSKGTAYMSGEIEGVKIVLFKNQRTNDKQPHWTIYKSQPREGQ